jgi:hypothetical protein
MKLLKTCENSSQYDRSITYDVALYEAEECYMVAVCCPWGYDEKCFESFADAARYYTAEAYEAMRFDFSDYEDD